MQKKKLGRPTKSETIERDRVKMNILSIINSFFPIDLALSNEEKMDLEYKLNKALNGLPAFQYREKETT